MGKILSSGPLMPDSGISLGGLSVSFSRRSLKSTKESQTSTGQREEKESYSSDSAKKEAPDLHLMHAELKRSKAK